MVKPSDTLVKAYGQRVSDISTFEKAKPKNMCQYGLFEKYAGADVTVIWAIITSDKAIIVILLLVYMLV